RNGARLDVERVAWDDAASLVDRGPWDLVLAADVLYERRHLDPLLALLPRLGAEAWIADPGRPPAETFLTLAGGAYDVRTTRDRVTSQVAVHRLRLRD